MNVCVLSSILHKDIRDTFYDLFIEKFSPTVISPKDYQGEDAIFYIQTGGTEGIFLDILELIPKEREIILLSSKENNSLAAAMEIAAFLSSKNYLSKIIHGSLEGLNSKKSIRLGIIGKPSDWLIASSLDEANLLDNYNIELVHIDLSVLYEAMTDNIIPSIDDNAKEFLASRYKKEEDLNNALKIYMGLQLLVAQYQLMGFTIRCFDLIEKYKNTGCLALSLFNKQGIVATCEGDIKTLITMYYCQAILKEPGFQANPSSIDDNPLSITFAHCTIPLQMITSYQLMTHFESDLGVAINGKIKDGPVTIIKIDFDKKKYVCFEADRIAKPYNFNLCRTQITIKITTQIKHYFLHEPLGNHHVITLGRNKQLFDIAMQEYGLTSIL